MTQICCGALYGSHTQRCDLNIADRLVCYCCGGTFPSHWCCLWNPKGSRCFSCEPHAEPCRQALGCRLEQGSEQASTVKLGTWPSNDFRRAFAVEEEAERQYPDGKPRDNCMTTFEFLATVTLSAIGLALVYEEINVVELWRAILRMMQ